MVIIVGFFLYQLKHTVWLARSSINFVYIRELNVNAMLFVDFLPMLIYVLVQCGIVAAEIEADYMWGLIHPSLLNGEGGYYLTSLSSAVLALKNFKNMQGSLSDQQQVLERILL